MHDVTTEPRSGGELPGAGIARGEHGDAPIVVTGSREQLFHLLAEAAEIEHCLMCSYLYAAFSLKRAPTPGLTEAQGKMVARWHQQILGVAIEEMGHLLILSNIATAIGGRPHLSRPNFPIASGYFPSGVVVRLAGFSAETIEHFIYLERPRGVEGNDPDSYAQPDYSRRQVHLGLMPNAQQYATIGYLYDAIRENLIGLADRLGEDALFIGGGSGQLAPPAIDLPGVERVVGLASALRGIDLIVEQGEGSAADRADTHYRIFMDIREEYRAALAADPAFAPAWPVAENPVLRCPPEPEDKVFIDDPQAAPLLDAACSAYGLLLRLLAQCFGEEAGSSDLQERLFGVAVEMMHVVGDCGRALAELPATDRRPGVHAGLSFTMLRGLEALRPGLIGERLLSEEIERFVQGAMLIEQIADAVRKRMNALAL